MSIKIAHEAPNSIFEEVQRHTDYDYFLVHLFEDNPKYVENYWKAKQAGRYVILDNSIFELGEAFNMEKFAEKVIELQPDLYVIPDSLENRNKTIDNADTWNKKYRDKCHNSKCMGVVQGRNFYALTDCYQYLDHIYEVDVLGISFDYSYYRRIYRHPNTKISWTVGRPMFINNLLRKGHINVDKPHHLLGCATPNEGAFYKDPEFSFIHSIDTSNPVVYGLLKGKYPEGGLWKKESKKLHTMIDMEVDPNALEDIKHNMGLFRKIWTD